MAAETSKLLEHFFRHEYGRLVAVLTHRLGLRHLDLAEDVAQSALFQAIQHWARKGVPDNPSGWLYRVALRLAIDALRKESTQSRLLVRLQREKGFTDICSSEVSGRMPEEETMDDQLHLLLACCSPHLSHASSIALSLKVMSGFSVAEISHAMMTSEANVQKRITRAKERLRENSSLGVNAEFHDRIDAASMVIYLMFNEGYLTSHAEVSIRRDLCEEAIRLAKLLLLHADGATPSVFALLALMSFQIARLEARSDSSGEILLLDRQDRSSWDWQTIREGMDWMEKSAFGCQVTRFHIEANIAWEHCRARTFDDTDWPRIRELYQILLQRVSSPSQWLNRAVAEFYCFGSKAALSSLRELPVGDPPKGYPMWFAVIGFFYYSDGNFEEAKNHWGEALKCTHSRAEQELLRRRIALCQRQER